MQDVYHVVLECENGKLYVRANSLKDCYNILTKTFYDSDNLRYQHWEIEKNGENCLKEYNEYVTSLENAHCGSCGLLGVKIEYQDHKFRYGVGFVSVGLKALVPFHICAKCGTTCIDYKGEAEIDRIVRIHLLKLEK